MEQAIRYDHRYDRLRPSRPTTGASALRARLRAALWTRTPRLLPGRAQRPRRDLDAKSAAGRRGIGLPDPLVVLLRHHTAEQAAEREAAGQLWHDEGWLFADPRAGPST